MTRISILWLAVWLMVCGQAYAEEMKAYENKQAGLRMRYPAGWVMDDKVAGVLVAFGAPQDKANLKLVENVTVVVQDLVRDERLETYTRSYEQQLKNDPSTKVIESKKTMLGALPAHRIVCVGQQGNLQIQFLQVWTVKGGKAYLFTYGASKDTFGNFLSEAESIISSLKFL